MVASIATLGAAIGALGCADSRPFLGDWVGRRSVPRIQGQDPYLRETLATVTLSVRKDGTFTLREEGFEKNGQWSAGRDGLTLTIRRILDRPLSPDDPMGGARTLRKDGSGVSLHSTGYEPVALSPAKP